MPSHLCGQADTQRETQALVCVGFYFSDKTSRRSRGNKAETLRSFDKLDPPLQPVVQWRIHAGTLESGHCFYFLGHIHISISSDACKKHGFNCLVQDGEGMTRANCLCWLV